MPNEIAERATSIPDWMRKASTGTKLGNIDGSDLKPPRLKLLAGMSPEIMGSTPGAYVGQFWLTILNKNLGPTVVGTPILLKKSYAVWAPRMAGAEGRGPLAMASDGIHWDNPNQEFEVVFPREMGGGKETWKIGKTVFENRTHKFGSSRPGDPKSKPIATLTYDMLWVVDMPDGRRQLCVWQSTRTGVTPTQNFISTCQAKIEEGVDQFYQRYRIVAVKKAGPSGDPYFTYDYWFEGTLDDEEDGKRMRAIFDSYSKSGFVTDMGDEAEDIYTARSEGKKRDIDDDEIPF